jgi:hypothetical protein
MSARFCSECGGPLHRDEHGDRRCDKGHTPEENALLKAILPVLVDHRHRLERIEEQGERAAQLAEGLREEVNVRLNTPHLFQHVDELGWKGKLDHNLFRDAASRSFDALTVLDVDQLADPDLCRALKASGLHHISLRQGRRIKGKAGVARVIASIVAAMPYVLADLEESSGQRLVEVTLLASGARHETFDPRRDRERFPYWPA